MARTKDYDRTELLKTTTQLFWRQGLADTSLADIERSTGVNKSSLYAEFADKDDLFVASLTHYIQTNRVYETLSREPLGKTNLSEFLELGKSCSGQRGCFVVNSMRESAILPARAKDVIHSHLKKVKTLLVANIKAAHAPLSSPRQSPESIADLILTFNAGLCLELNAVKSPVRDKITAFMQLIQL